MRFERLLAMTAFVTAAFVPTTSRAADEPKITFVRELGGIREFRVEANALQVLLARDTSAPVATVMTTFHVGSRNEVTGTTGATHLLEHLYFKGTERFNRTAGTSLDLLLDRVGAINNATTWTDRTNYYVNTPSDQLPLVFDLLADHMLHLRLREEDRKPEMTVVRNEFEIGENDPQEALDKAIWASAFTAHPYHHSTIGWRSDIERVPIEKLREFHRTFYWPDNCTLTIAGDFTEETALQLVRKYFAMLPKAPHPLPPMYTEEPEQQGPRRVIVKRPAELGAVGVGFKRPGARSTDSAALTLLSRVLTEGKNARLYRALVDAGLATDVNIANYEFIDPCLFTVYALLAPGAQHEKVEKVLRSTLETLVRDGITAEELARAKQQFTADTAFSRDGSMRVAEQLNEFIAAGDWTRFINFNTQVAAVTTADVQRVAKSVLVDDQSTTGWFIALEEGSAPHENTDEEKPSETPERKTNDHTAPTAVVVASVEAAAPLPASASSEPLAQRATQRSIHGIEFVAVPTGVKDVVTIEGSLAAGNAFNPAGNTAVAEVVAALLDKGTAQHDKLALARELDDLGATIHFSSDAFALRFSARCLKRDSAKVIALLAEQLRTPAFLAEEIAKEKTRLEGDWQRAQEEPDVRAAIALSQVLWPEGHPNRQPDADQQIADLKKVTREQIVAFHRAQFGPKSLRFVAVGDLDPAAIADSVEKSFQGWSGGTAYPKPAKVTPPAKPGRVVPVPMEEKPSTIFLLGQTTGVAANEADALPLKLATHVLGGGSFSSRLVAIVRDTEGLTYRIGARIADDTFSDGSWWIRGTFATELLGQGESSSRRELQRWYEKGFDDTEFAAQKANFLGVAKLDLATSDGLARRLLQTLERGQALSEIDTLDARVAALRKADVEAAMRRLLDPAKMIAVKAGTLPK